MSALREFRGKRVWEPDIGIGSFVTMNLGGTRVNSLGRTIGEYYLWVYGARWMIRHGSSVIATSHDTKATMERAAARFDGESVVDAEFDPEGPWLTITLTGDLMLLVGPTAVPDMESWLLFLPDGNVISSGPGTALVHESASG